jgi:hypothetical protein
VDDLSPDKQTSSQKLLTFVFTSIPHLQSRIMHAAKAILPELVRGHFVPMMTIALACLGRIRSILMQIGRECLTCLRENKVQNDESTNHLFEIGHDELTLKMNAVVNQLRWRDVVQKFGLDKSLLNVLCGNTDTSAAAPTIAVKSNKQDIEVSMNNDMGEVLSGPMGVTEDNATVVKKGSEATERPKKKKRKGKKSKKKDDQIEIDQSNLCQQELISGSNEDLPAAEETKEQRHDTDTMVMIDANTPGPDESNPRDFNNEVAKSTKSKKPKGKKRSRDSTDSIFDKISGEQSLDAVKDLNAHKKKKSKKKKKKGSVIDDIFS